MDTLSEYCAFLNDEAVAGSAAQELLAAADPRELLRRHPAWLRLGVIDEVLGAARLAFDSNAAAALELTQFLIEIVGRIRVPDEFAFLAAQLEGTAWKEHGNALFMLSRLPDALVAAERAVDVFSAYEVLAVERARARVLVALIMQAQGDLDAADRLVGQSIQVFAEHGQARPYLSALQTQAIIALSRNDALRARELYRCAYDEADRLDDDRERSRIQNNLARIALYLHDLDAATDHLDRAFLGFSRNQMFGELSRSIRNAGLLAMEQGKFAEALTALHGTYARFLDRGMITEATAVNLEIGNAVLALTGDLAYAQQLCTKLEVTLGRYDVPAEVAKAVRYAAKAARSATTAAAFGDVLEQICTFFRELLTSSSAVFTPLPETTR